MCSYSAKCATHMYGVKYATRIAAAYYLRFLRDSGEFQVNERRECRAKCRAIILLYQISANALLLAKSQLRVLEVSDESVETNLANFEFSVSLCLLKEGRKEGSHEGVRTIYQETVNRNNCRQRVVSADNSRAADSTATGLSDSGSRWSDRLTEGFGGSADRARYPPHRIYVAAYVHP
ncbi:hypothetical protein ALC57_17989 [Trachymyrmex cornetzi]|uniref:Uncharacterized protein n=1 Tax=Trachymyrmex cornetzi TaxID=471704 RepID=A0A151ISQ4_9HYME|nr:hypothetical protein ALC57_17989 [Trachymyrmex cornetzi]